VYVTQIEPETVTTNFQNVGVRCLPAERVGLSKVKEMFASRGIEVRSYFDPPLYKFNGHENAPLPVTEAAWRTLLSFPIYSRMEEPVLARIEQAILEIGNELQSSA
jgi:dTDP-4-amino-4,6-dideoxygalactose transaminase